MLKSSSLCLYSSNLGTFWLKIEQFWPFEEISIFSNGGHLGYRTALTDTILKGDHPRIISAKFGWDWLSSFRGEDFVFISSPLFSIFSLAAILLEVRITGHSFGRGPSKDHSTKVWGLEKYSEFRHGRRFIYHHIGGLELPMPQPRF